MIDFYQRWHHTATYVYSSRDESWRLIVDAANMSSSLALMLKLGNEYASDESVLRDYRRFGQIWTIFASVELKIFETVIAFLNNRISCITVTIIQLFSPISPQTFWGLNQALGGAKARLAPPSRNRHCCSVRPTGLATAMAYSTLSSSNSCH